MGASFKNQQAFPCSVQQMVAVIKDPAFCKKLNLKAVEVARENVGEEPQEQNNIAFDFTHGATFTSWGENITVTLTPGENNGTCVEVYSVCVEEQQMIDAGKNKSNTKRILAYIEKALKNQETAMQAAAYQAAAVQSAYQAAAQNAALQAAQPPVAPVYPVQPVPPVYPVQPVPPAQPMQPVVPQRRFCIHCGQPLKPGSRFCAFCGAPQQ